MTKIMKRKVPFKEKDIPGYGDNLGIKIIKFVAFLLRGIAYENMKSGSRCKFVHTLFECRNICQETKGPKDGIIRFFVIQLLIRCETIEGKSRSSVNEESSTLQTITPKGMREFKLER